MYGQWRFRGIHPFELYTGLPVSEALWPARIEAVMQAFAIHAAMHERTIQDIAKAFAGSDDGEG